MGSVLLVSMAAGFVTMAAGLLWADGAIHGCWRGRRGFLLSVWGRRRVAVLDVGGHRRRWCVQRWAGCPLSVQFGVGCFLVAVLPGGHLRHVSSVGGV